jgi:hypothetical protein
MVVVEMKVMWYLENIMLENVIGSVYVFVYPC